MAEADRKRCIFLLFLGCLLLISPLCFGYSSSKIGISDSITGLILLLNAAISLFYFNYRTLLILFFVGFWLLYSPIKFWVIDPSIFIRDTLLGYFIVFLVFQFDKMNAAREPLPIKHIQKIMFYPSGWGRRYASALCALLICLIGSYLGSYEAGFIDAIWDPIFGSNSGDVFSFVSEDYFVISESHFFSFLGYVIFIFSFQGDSNRWLLRPWLPILQFLISAFIFCILIFLMIVVSSFNHAWSIYNLSMAVAAFGMVFLSVNEFMTSFSLLMSIKNFNDRRRAFWCGIKAPFVEVIPTCRLGLSFSCSTLAIGLVSLVFLLVVQCYFIDQSLGHACVIAALVIICSSLISLNLTCAKIIIIPSIASFALAFSQFFLESESRPLDLLINLYSFTVIALSVMVVKKNI
ncbi:MAG: hypothetical protein FJZ57_04635 [Chlamydiae bacterium]|nr:hypothetical protein [Chlamydiota bacterium]